MTSELYEFKSIGNDYGVIVTWGGFMKKLTQEFGVVKEVIKGKGEWCEANAWAVFE